MIPVSHQKVMEKHHIVSRKSVEYCLLAFIAICTALLCLLYKSKRKLEPFQVTIMGGAGAGKTATLALLFRVFCWHFSVQLTIAEQKDLLNLLKHGNSRVQGRFPACLEITRNERPLRIEFCDASYSPGQGYLRYQDHDYIANSNLLIFCIALDGNSQQQNRAFDEMMALTQLIQSNKKWRGNVPFLAVLTHMAVKNFPDWQHAFHWVKRELGKTQPNIMRKCCLFPGHRFWFTPYDAGEIWNDEVSHRFKEQWSWLIDWITENTVLGSKLGKGRYRKLYRISGQEQWLISLVHRWEHKRENFVMYLPSGKISQLYCLDNHHRYWSITSRVFGNCQIYDVLENKYLYGQCIGHKQVYLVLENAVVIHQSRKLCGKQIAWDENVFCSGGLYLDISTDVVLAQKGFQGRYLSYPKGETIDLVTGKIGVLCQGRFRDIGSIIDSLISPKKRLAARQALVAMGPASAFYMVLSLEKTGERATAIKRELENIASPPLRVVKQLIPLLKYQKPAICHAAAKILAKIDNDETAQALLFLLESSESSVRSTVVKILEQIKIAAL